jgi:integrase
VFFHEGRQKWVGGKVVGKTATGKVRYAERWGDTQAEVIKKLDLAGPAGPDTMGAAGPSGGSRPMTIRDSTKASYRCSLAHILPALGPARVAAVTRSDAAVLIADLARKGDLAAGTIRNVHAHGKAMFEAARGDGLILTNPFATVPHPRGKQKPIDPFTPAELLKIIATAPDLTAGGVIALLAATGCRVGEAIALDVTDWNPKTGKVTITKSYSKKFGMGPPKSKHSRRTITVPAVVRHALNAAAAGRTSEALFLTGGKRRFIKSMVQRAFDIVFARFGVRPRNPHQLRHSVASALVADGAKHRASAAKYLGDSVATVVRTYLHADDTDPADTLNRLLAASKGGRKVGNGSGRRSAA